MCIRKCLMVSLFLFLVCGGSFGLTRTFPGKMVVTYTAAPTAEDGSRYFSFTTTDTRDATTYAEITSLYGAYKKTAGSNGTYTVNGIEGVASSQYADEAGSFRGASLRTYTYPGNVATMRTAVGADMSARAGYSGANSATPESGTCFTGARIYMAPYFNGSAGTIASNVNNFHGLWVFNEHPSIPVTNAIRVNNAASGGYTNGLNMTDANMTTDIILHNGNFISNPSVGLVTIDASLNSYFTEGSAAADGTRYFSFTTTNTVDAAANAEVTGLYGAYNKTAGSNGVFTANGVEGVARSNYADEAGTFRGASLRTYTYPGNTATMRTAVGADISARAGYAVGAGAAATPESGTCFTGARIWMAPYFQGGNSTIATNVNNFHGLWIYNEHPSVPVTNAIMINNAASGGYTNGVNLTGATVTNDLVLHSGDTVKNSTAGTIDVSADIKITSSLEGVVIRGDDNAYYRIKVIGGSISAEAI